MAESRFQPLPDEPSDDPLEGKMGFLDHLDELRKRIIRACIAIVAVLTPSADPWNQTLFAAPIIGLYLVSIAIAWIVEPKREKGRLNHTDSTGLRLVIGAMVIDRATKHHTRPPGDVPRARHRCI